MHFLWELVRTLHHTFEPVGNWHIVDHSHAKTQSHHFGFACWQTCGWPEIHRGGCATRIRSPEDDECLSCHRRSHVSQFINPDPNAGILVEFVPATGALWFVYLRIVGAPKVRVCAVKSPVQSNKQTRKCAEGQKQNISTDF